MADPSGEEQAARAAEYEAARQSRANRGSSGWVRTVSCMKWISTTSSDCGDGLIAGSTVRRRALPLLTALAVASLAGGTTEASQTILRPWA